MHWEVWKIKGQKWFKLLNSFIYLINHKIYRNLLFRVGESSDHPLHQSLHLPHKWTERQTRMPADPPLSRVALINRFPVSIFSKSKLEKRHRFSDRPSQKDWVVSFSKSKRAYLPQKRNVNKSQKKYNIYLYSYINIQRDQMLFYHWFTQCSSSWSEACWEPFASFSVLFTDVV